MDSHEGNDERWLDNMRGFYLSRADEKLKQLSQAVQGLLNRPSSPSAYRKLDRLLHNLIGSGGSYGLPEVSEAAREMLTSLKLARENGDLPGAELMSDLRDGMERLVGIFQRAARNQEAHN